MTGSMVTRIVNVPVKFVLLTLMIWSLLISLCAHGLILPTTTPTHKPLRCPKELRTMVPCTSYRKTLISAFPEPCQLLQAWKTKIPCAGYTALLSAFPSTSPSVLSVNTRQKMVVARNVTTHPVTLENLFLDETVYDHRTNGLHRFKTIAGGYLSVDGNGHLTISTRRRKANFLLVEKENYTTCMCAQANGRNHSFLVSPFSKSVKLQKDDCETQEKFNNALKSNKELKAALEMEEHRFRVVAPVTKPTLLPTEYLFLVSDELRSVCCSFDDNCDSKWFQEL